MRFTGGGGGGGSLSTCPAGAGSITAPLATVRLHRHRSPCCRALRAPRQPWGSLSIPWRCDSSCDRLVSFTSHLGLGADSQIYSFFLFGLTLSVLLTFDLTSLSWLTEMNQHHSWKLNCLCWQSPLRWHCHILWGFVIVFTWCTIKLHLHTFDGPLCLQFVREASCVWGLKSQTQTDITMMSLRQSLWEL